MNQVETVVVDRKISRPRGGSIFKSLPVTGTETVVKETDTSTEATGKEEDDEAAEVVELWVEGSECDESESMKRMSLRIAAIFLMAVVMLAMIYLGGFRSRRSRSEEELMLLEAGLDVNFTEITFPPKSKASPKKDYVLIGNHSFPGDLGDILLADVKGQSFENLTAHMTRLEKVSPSEMEKTLSTIDEFNTKMAGIFAHISNLLKKIAAESKIVRTPEYMNLSKRLKRVYVMRRKFEAHRHDKTQAKSLVVFGQIYMEKVNELFSASDEFHAMRERIESEEEYKRRNRFTRRN